MNLRDFRQAANLRLLRSLGYDFNAYTVIEAQPLAIPWVSSREPVYAPESTDVPPTISGYGYQHLSPIRHAYTVGDVVTSGRHGYLIGQKKVLAESSSWPAQDCIVALGNARKARPSGAVLSSATLMPQNSYYHWLLEDLPAFLMARERSPEAVVVTHANPPSYVSDFLSKYDSSPARYFKGSIRLESASFVSKRGISGIPQTGDIEILESRLSIRNERSESPYLYVSRRGSMRSLKNEKTLEDELEKIGFLVVRSQDLSFSEQVTLFSNSRGVVGVHGAGLANSVFMKSGFMLEILSPEWPNPCFEVLAMKKGLLFERVLSRKDSNTVSISQVIGVAEQLISRVS